MEIRIRGIRTAGKFEINIVPGTLQGLLLRRREDNVKSGLNEVIRL